MEFDLKIDIVDVNTGEVLTRNKQCSYNTDIEKENEKIQRYVDCFIRGLRQGKSIALCISASKYHFPVQTNLF